jgi:GNAT superfamily N-acetyltransferase
MDIMPSYLRQVNGVFYKSCVLERIYVQPKFRCKGVGKAMIFRLASFADKNQFLVLLNDSTAYGSDPKRLRKFYIDMGFVLAKNLGIHDYTLCRIPIKRQQ